MSIYEQIQQDIANLSGLERYCECGKQLVCKYGESTVYDNGPFNWFITGGEFLGYYCDRCKKLYSYEEINAN